MPQKILLTAAQIAEWEQNGLLVLRGALQPDAMAAVQRVVDRQWEERASSAHEIDVTSGPDQGKTFRLRDAKTEHRDEVYKLNNLFLHEPEIRRISHIPVVRAALIDLLEGEPMICNSLNLERGSQQPFHFDTWFMPPPVDGRMVAASFALEPVDAENGPLIYYPGSHAIPPWRFAGGGLNYRPEEEPEMEAYLRAHITRRKLRPEAYAGQAGDVILWHAYLYHGGAAILDKARTRRSMVVHYWRAGDLPAKDVKRDDHGAYLSRTLRGEIAAH